MLGNIIMKIRVLLAGGPLLNKDFLRKHGRFILFLFALCIIYIAGDIILGLELKETGRLENKLLRSRIKYNNEFSESLKLRRYPEILNQIKRRGLNLKESETPPKTVKK
ncbi:MAG: hypothetical protein LBC98_01880 [Prevotellaceae bacterium]|nr:hypothetical protein [Prevotellaceae bacterium]